MFAEKIDFSGTKLLGAQGNEEVLQLVEMVNLSEMSSIRSSVSAIVRVLNNPKSTVKDLEEVIQLDPPLVARVLKTANSAFFSRSFRKVFTDIEQAIIWMGLEVIRELALDQKVCEIFDKDEKIGEYSRKALWRHSIAVAILCKMIYRKEFGLRGENVYVAGLLHDIGLIAEDQFLYNDFVKILNLAKTKNISLSTAEKKILGYDHAEVGEAISFSWDLPDELLVCIGAHTNPTQLGAQHIRMACTLFVADYFCKNNEYHYGLFPEQDHELFDKCLKQLDVKPMAIDMIFKRVKQEMTKKEEEGLI